MSKVNNFISDEGEWMRDEGEWMRDEGEWMRGMRNPRTDSLGAGICYWVRGVDYFISTFLPLMMTTPL